MMHREYRTPQRRHSSLFQRMQEEIQKISRKLSQAKGISSARPSSYQKNKSFKKDNPKQQRQNYTPLQKQKAKENIFETTNSKQRRKNVHFDDFLQPSIVETVRIKRRQQNQLEFSPISGKKTITSKTLNRRLNFVPLRENQQERIFKLEQQNEELTFQIKKLQAVCTDQSYRLGYASAYFDDKCKKLQQQKEQCLKQNIYLQKLCEHYKSKSKKFQEHLRKYSSRRVSQQSNELYD